jgi:hypothetical protein
MRFKRALKEHQQRGISEVIYVGRPMKISGNDLEWITRARSSGTQEIVGCFRLRYHCRINSPASSMLHKTVVIVRQASQMIAYGTSS